MLSEQRQPRAEQLSNPKPMRQKPRSVPKAKFDPVAYQNSVSQQMLNEHGGQYKIAGSEKVAGQYKIAGNAIDDYFSGVANRINNGGSEKVGGQYKIAGSEKVGGQYKIAGSEKVAGGFTSDLIDNLIGRPPQGGAKGKTKKKMGKMSIVDALKDS
jgi:hypothetical protein